MPTSNLAIDHPSSEAGFTLIELLVALVLFSMVGLTFVHFQTFQLGASHQLSAKAAARLAADSLSVDLMVARAAPKTRISGQYEQAGRQYQWQATPRPLAEEQEIPELVAVDLELHSTDGTLLQQRTLFRPMERKLQNSEDTPEKADNAR